MGTHSYQHYLLWSEDRKRVERKREVEQDLRFANYKKDIARMQLNQEREDVSIFFLIFWESYHQISLIIISFEF